MEKSWRCLGAVFLAIQLCPAMDAFPAAARTNRLAAQMNRLDALVRAYPDFLAGHDRSTLEWSDGSRMRVSDGNRSKTFHERLRSASIADQLRLTYPKGRRSKKPARGSDPGRFRNTAFFDKMYGDCTQGETQRNLVKITWLAKLGGGDVGQRGCRAAEGRVRRTGADAEAQAVPASERGDFQLQDSEGYRAAQHACLGGGDRHQHALRRLLAVERAEALPEPHPMADRRRF